MRSTSYIVKLVVLCIALVLATYLLSSKIVLFVLNEQYFGFDLIFALTTVLLMLAVDVIYFLSIGGWGNTSKYFITPIPLAFAASIPLLFINKQSALIFLIAAFLLMCKMAHNIAAVEKLLIKFKPQFIYKVTGVSTTLVFSLLAAFLTYLNISTQNDINIGKKVSSLVGENVNTAIKGQIQNSLQQQLGEETNYIQHLDPIVADSLKQLGVPTDFSDQSLLNPENLGINTNEIIENQINSLIQPYKGFYAPFLALLAFSVIAFYAFIEKLLFFPILGIVHFIALKTGFYKIETVPAEKEILKF